MVGRFGLLYQYNHCTRSTRAPSFAVFRSSFFLVLQSRHRCHCYSVHRRYHLLVVLIEHCYTPTSHFYTYGAVIIITVVSFGRFGTCSRLLKFMDCCGFTPLAFSVLALACS
ncbi:hypothetical protein L218DRAFT_301392 [Marasmius fiardii PR-910]|nr:hypothetical protein L218DRAFT_301392 [Marasmius fiardii PR-910]